MITKKQREKEIKSMTENEQEYYRPIAIKIHKALDERGGMTVIELSHLLERIEKERYVEHGFQKVWKKPSWGIQKI